MNETFREATINKVDAIARELAEYLLQTKEVEISGIAGGLRIEAGGIYILTDTTPIFELISTIHIRHDDTIIASDIHLDDRELQKRLFAWRTERLNEYHNNLNK